VLDDVEHGRLNDRGVNVLRVFAGRSTPTVWGARTTSNNTDWRYVNVRRLFLFIEESIQEGIRWAVFEPNDLSLWKRLDRTITEFLTRVWSSGALFGATAAEAFYVKVDQSNNPDPELGQVVVEVGVAPVRPAEFVVVQIGIWAGGGQVQEG
jgi:phage tail sheath protein FI